MTRAEFHRLFKCPGPVVTPVIHVLDREQVLRNIRVAVRSGVPGVFLINHDFPVGEFIPIITDVRKSAPNVWTGVNFLAIPGRDAFPILGRLQADDCPVNAYWADDARIDERVEHQTEAEAARKVYSVCGWNGLYFGGVAFKKQREVRRRDFEGAARIAASYMDVVTTSGVATGHAADVSKVSDFREGVGDRPLALASGVTPENVSDYATLVDCFLVATGINYAGDFYNIDPGRLDELMAVARRYGEEP